MSPQVFHRDMPYGSVWTPDRQSAVDGRRPTAPRDQPPQRTCHGRTFKPSQHGACPIVMSCSNRACLCATPCTGIQTCAVRPPARPSHALQSTQCNSRPACSLAGQSIALSGPDSAPTGTTVNVRQPAARACAVSSAVSQLAMHQCASAGSHVRHWCVYPVCMADCVNTVRQTAVGTAAGWRTFTVVPVGAESGPDRAILCPASEQAGRLLHCVDCKACDGRAGGRTAHVWIPVHGVALKQARFEQLITIGHAPC